METEILWQRQREISQSEATGRSQLFYCTQSTCDWCFKLFLSESSTQPVHFTTTQEKEEKQAMRYVEMGPCPSMLLK
jgi:hypothetical protein